MTDVFLKRGYLDIETQAQRKGSVKEQGEHHVKGGELKLYMQAKKYQKLPTNHQKPERSTELILPHRPQQESTLPTPWCQTSSLQNHKAINGCYCGPPILWYFVKAAPGS